MSELRFRLEEAGVRVGTAALRALPIDTSQRLAGAVARRIFDAGGKRVGYALANLRLAYPDAPEEELRRIGRESYAHFAWNLIDFARSERWSEAEIRQHMHFRGLEEVDAALEGGRGAFGLTLHLGNFELAVYSYPLHRPAVAAVARPMANERLYRRLLGHRSRYGTEIIDRRNAARAILRALRANKLVAILNDQYSRRSRGVFVPLFGARCSTSAGIATLAVRSGAPILPFFVVRDAPDHHTGTFGPPLELELSGDRARDIAHTTERCNAAIEALIRKYPEQWMWAHRRFRHSPDLPDDLYASK